MGLVASGRTQPCCGELCLALGVFLGTGKNSQWNEVSSGNNSQRKEVHKGKRVPKERIPKGKNSQRNEGPKGKNSQGKEVPNGKKLPKERSFKWEEVSNGKKFPVGRGSHVGTLSFSQGTPAIIPCHLPESPSGTAEFHISHYN